MLLNYVLPSRCGYDYVWSLRQFNALLHHSHTTNNDSQT